MNLNPKHRRKPFWNKKIILLVSLSLIFAIGAGVTYAYLTGYDGQKYYTFSGANVVNQSTQWHNTTDVYYIRVQNTGNTTGYVRAQQVFLWVKRDDTFGVLDTKEVLGLNLEKGKDYNTYREWTDDQQISDKGEETNLWHFSDPAQNGDGYYYHTQPVEAGDYTTYLQGCTPEHQLLENGNNYAYPYTNTYPLVDPPGEGYRLEWTMVTDIIQAAPDTTWQEAWAKIAVTEAQMENGMTEAEKNGWEIPSQSRPTPAN